MKAYIDSDVLIWHLRGEHKALNLLKRLRDDEQFDLWIGAMQRAEVVFFMRPAEESSTLLFLAQFQTASVDQRIIDKAGEFYRKCSSCLKIPACALSSPASSRTLRW
jgi:predicted nucleic acid-binding protein